ncbi:nose resistant to fluoxetine protein 6-like [Macrosteles quadrilineatus]|uniref:nose resistant to fluoxetine protein 6-like n=1 Tax=Macrosteles quadrilineatus TaxID=74068 RepID=UPI0023E17070|nr:nose resistant to fluoxetine protein 6-like [Macrosteles quadrilineatus]
MLVQKWAGWIASLLLILASVLSVSIFQDPEYVYTPWLDSTYGILHRPALSLGVGWVILACSTGNGGVVNSLLGWSGMVVLSRLTYCAFLVHFFVQDVQAFSTKTAVTTDFLNLWFLFSADFVISYLLAAVLHLTVEAPVNNILKIFLKQKDSKLEAVPSTSGTQLQSTVGNIMME